MQPKTLEEVAAYLRSLGTPELDDCAAVCERVAKERQELMGAVTRLSRRLTRCSQELAKHIGNLK